MHELSGRVAVVTGAASGIGRGLAERFAAEGMRVVLADYEQAALDATVAELQAAGREVLGVHTDVSKPESVEALADRAFEVFGAVHVLCNNAGVLVDADNPRPLRGGRGDYVWEHPQSDWDWTFGVNFWGIVHGIRSFVPRMLQSRDEGHIVNTSSVAGLSSGASPAIYGSSKHAVVRISEALFLQMREQDSKLGVSVLCPGRVMTRIAVAARNRPTELAGSDTPLGADEAEQLREDWAARPIERHSPEHVAGLVVDAIREQQFYVLTDDEWDDRIRSRFEDLIAHRNPDAARW